jgi:hypothetical protein
MQDANYDFSPTMYPLADLGPDYSDGGAEGMSIMEQKFWRFHKANPHVYDALTSLALESKRAGWRRAGVALFYERLRWLWAEHTRGGKYKLCNNHRAYYSRLLLHDNPVLAGFLIIKKQRYKMVGLPAGEHDET